jgi:hypothetical protein
MVERNISYIDESGNGSGPFYNLAKSSTEGSINKGQTIAFFNALIESVRNGKNVTGVQAFNEMKRLKQQHIKKKLCIKVSKQPQTDISVQDLVNWLRT